MPKKEWKPPYLGAAYYPEDWPLEQIDEDIAQMKRAGMNVMRIAEFAWSRMEPTEGHYDFSWLHLVIDKLGENGIATILCTPTCTPPAWLTKKHPETLIVMQNGVPHQHGARRHACPNSPVYRDYCTRITEKMLDEFSGNENIIGWQIDNELYPAGGQSGMPSYGCHCPVCTSKFTEFLKKRFNNDLAALNAAWGTDLWSQTYTAWDEIPAPREGMWHHPSLVTAWAEFSSDSVVDFTNHQARLLKRSGLPVGTDMMPFGGLNYREIEKELSVVQFNHYNTMDNLWQASFWMNYMRPLLPPPFWNTETSTCWNGANTANGYREPGFCRANSWVPFVLGGEANLYWLWRAHWSGQELMHGAVLSSQGRPMHIFGEVQEVAEGLRKAEKFLNGTKVKTKTALHFSCDAWALYKGQKIVNGFEYIPMLLDKFYRPMIDAGLTPDVIDPAADLAPYDVLVSPFLASLEWGGLSERVVDWVKNGGTWIVGPMSDIRNVHAAKYISAALGHLENWMGTKTRYEIPGDPRDFLVKWPCGLTENGGLWYDSFEQGDCETTATYVQGPMEGLAAVVERSIGMGRIILLGTVPGKVAMQKLLSKSAEGARHTLTLSPGVIAAVREGEAGSGYAAVELGNKEGYLRTDAPTADLITGETFEAGDVPMKPYAARVLVKR